MNILTKTSQQSHAPIIGDRRLGVAFFLLGAAMVHSTPPTHPASLPPPVDADTWDLTSWRAWPWEREQLGQRQAPLIVPGSPDWVRTADSWVGKRDRSSEPGPAEQLSYSLQVTDFYLTGGGNKKGPNRIFCASAVPMTDGGPFPVLFVFHGGGGHASGALAVAIARRNPGFAAVAIDYNGQFRPSKTPVTHWVTLTPELREPRHHLNSNPLNFPLYHYVQAARRVLDWAQDQSWADAERFGAVGVSYGGWVSYVLAGVDDRIRSVVANVSAGGTEDCRGRCAQPLGWEPEDQRAVWLEHADPIAYAAQTRAPVFMRLCTNDRFFWLSGAVRHRAALGDRAAWLLVPNADHGHGGPELPDSTRPWHRAVFMNAPSLPTFLDLELSADGAAMKTRLGAVRPVRSVYAVWSLGNDVSPARYWQWTEARQVDGEWRARLPAEASRRTCQVYFTVIDVDGRAASSPLLERAGNETADQQTRLWSRDSLWDVHSGAAAWRPDLAFDAVRIRRGDDGAVMVTPVQPGARIAVLTNSFHLSASELDRHTGLRLHLGGNGASFKARISMARDYSSLDEQLFACDVIVPAKRGVVDAPWRRFVPANPAAAHTQPLPANGLAIRVDSLPATGLCIGEVGFLPAHRRAMPTDRAAGNMEFRRSSTTEGGED